jgi:hypothetical protein
LAAFCSSVVTTSKTFSGKPNGKHVEALGGELEVVALLSDHVPRASQPPRLKLTAELSDNIEASRTGCAFNRFCQCRFDCIHCAIESIGGIDQRGGWNFLCFQFPNSFSPYPNTNDITSAR